MIYNLFIQNHFRGRKRSIDNDVLTINTIRVNMLADAKICKYSGKFRAFDAEHTRQGKSYIGVLINENSKKPLFGYMTNDDIHFIQNMLQHTNSVQMLFKNQFFINNSNLNHYHYQSDVYTSYKNEKNFRTDYNEITQAFLHQYSKGSYAINKTLDNIFKNNHILKEDLIVPFFAGSQDFFSKTILNFILQKNKFNKEICRILNITGPMNTWDIIDLKTNKQTTIFNTLTKDQQGRIVTYCFIKTMYHVFTYEAPRNTVSNFFVYRGNKEAYEAK